MFLTIVAILIQVWLTYSLIEWLVHRYFMHGQWARSFKDHPNRVLRLLYIPILRHELGHHSEHTVHTYDAPPGVYRYMWLKTSSMIGLWTVWALFWSLISLTAHWAFRHFEWRLWPCWDLAIWINLAGAGIHVFLYELLHWHLHFGDPNSGFRKTRLYKFLDNHHRRHHGDMGKNFNVLPPVIDYIFGTVSKKRVPGEH